MFWIWEWKCFMFSFLLPGETCQNFLLSTPGLLKSADSRPTFWGVWEQNVLVLALCIFDGHCCSSTNQHWRKGQEPIYFLAISTFISVLDLKSGILYGVDRPGSSIVILVVSEIYCLYHTLNFSRNWIVVPTGKFESLLVGIGGKEGPAELELLSEQWDLVCQGIAQEGHFKHTFISVLCNVLYLESGRPSGRLVSTLHSTRRADVSQCL